MQAIHQQLDGLWCTQRPKEGQQRALPCPAVADQRNALAAADGQADIIQHGFKITIIHAVMEKQIAEFQLFPVRRRWLRRGFHQLGVFIQNIPCSAKVGLRAQPFTVNLQEAGALVADLLLIHIDRHKRTGGDSPAHIDLELDITQQDNRHHDGVEHRIEEPTPFIDEDLLHPRRHSQRELGAQRRLGKFLQAQDDNTAHVTDEIIERSIGLVRHFVQRVDGADVTPVHDHNKKHRKHEPGDADQADDPVKPQQHAQRPHQQPEFLEAVETILDESLQAERRGLDAVDGRAGMVILMPAEGQAGQTVVAVSRKGDIDILRHPPLNNAPRSVERPVAERRHDDQDQQHRNIMKQIRPAVLEQIHQLTEQVGLRQLDRHGSDIH